MPVETIVIVCLAAFIASGLTLFAGFGLGTLLLPVFVVFFPVDIAIALTAIVHLLNNLFKMTLLGKYADKTVLLRFGIPAIIFAVAGAYLLNVLTYMKPMLSYSIGNNAYNIMPVKFIMGIVIIVFVILEAMPAFKKLSFEKKYLPFGGILSGFFGGLSGHQGALRSAFLMKCGLAKESFIASGVVIAGLVDLTRISVYSMHFSSSGITENIPLLISASLSAFAGVFLGTKLLKKVTLKTVQITVSVLLSMIGVLLTTGLI
jgi:uncharacterized membrane protein YfcA